MTVSLNGEVRARLDAHLDAVERALMASGSSRERRRGVVDDLEAQILDMLVGKSDTPTLADLEGVLATLDPPAAYGDAATSRAVPLAVSPAQPARGNPAVPLPASRYSRTAIWGLVSILLSLVPLPFAFVLLMFFDVHNSHPAPVVFSSASGIKYTVPLPESPTTAPAMASTHARLGASFGWDGICVLLPSFPLALAGTILGCVALRQIQASRGKLRGKGMALFDALFFPGLIAIFFVVGLIHDLL